VEGSEKEKIKLDPRCVLDTSRSSSVLRPSNSRGLQRPPITIRSPTFATSQHSLSRAVSAPILSTFAHVPSPLFYGEPLGERLQGDVAPPLMTIPISSIRPHSASSVPLAVSSSKQRRPEPVRGASSRAQPLNPTSRPVSAVLLRDPPPLASFTNHFRPRSAQSAQQPGRTQTSPSANYDKSSPRLSFSPGLPGKEPAPPAWYAEREGSTSSSEGMEQYSPKGESPTTTTRDVEGVALQQALRRYKSAGALPWAKKGVTKVGAVC
jgi:hypothetical protein